MSTVELPDRVLCGHYTDAAGRSGCTVLLVPEGATGGAEVRGGGPGTREMDVVSPTSAARLVHGVLLTGGSAFGLAAADGVVSWLEERGIGHETRAGIRVPLVPTAVVFDPGALDPDARPRAEHGRLACDAARRGPPERGGVGAGTSTAAGKLLGPAHWTRTGVGAASERAAGVLVSAVAVVNPVGEVLDGDGSVLAGVRLEAAAQPSGTGFGWEPGQAPIPAGVSADGRGFVRTLDLIRAGAMLEPPPAREATTLVVVLTDAALDGTGAWLTARAATAGVARAVSPVATPYDGDVTICLATGAVPAPDLFVVGALAAEVTAAAIRDAATAVARRPS